MARADRRRRRRCAGLLALTAVAAGGLPAGARAADPVLPLADVRAGMRCTGFSVFRGTAVSAFDVEVLDVVAGDATASGPRILIRVSGPAVDATGVGAGFSGSPFSCPDAAGTPRWAGAISETIGEYGHRVVLATPMEAIIGVPVPAPAHARRLRARAEPLAAPLSVGGVGAPLARALAAAGARTGRPVLAVPPGPLGSFAPVAPRPGSAMAAGYATGDLSVSAVGTVAYVDGDRVWGFGHPLDGVGPRALLLEDAYVFRVIENPLPIGDDSTPAGAYKLAASGHVLGTVTMDGPHAITGRTGAPPPTAAVRVYVTDTGSGRRVGLETQVATETDADTPTGESVLSFIAPVAVAQGITSALGGAPARATGSLCMRLSVREHRRPLRFCSRYVSGTTAPDEAGNAVASAGSSAVLQAVELVDAFTRERLHVTELSVRATVARGQELAELRGVRLPARVRAGQRVRAQLSLQRLRGPRLTRRVTVRLPSDLPRGSRRLVFSGAGLDSADDSIIDVLVDSLDTSGGDDGGGLDGARSFAALAERVRRLGRWDGLHVRAAGDEPPGDRAYRDPELRIAGRASARVRVTG